MFAAGPFAMSPSNPEQPTKIDGAPSAPARPGGPGLRIGDLVADRYRIVAELGAGGMGVVYRATDERLGQDIALKIVSEQWAADARSVDALLEELRLARLVSHAHVCRVHDVGDWAGRPFLTMELVPGEDLASLSRRVGRLPREKALQLARQIGGGLAAVHARGVVHRDLKPANVLIDGDGNARLTDFGIAARADADGRVRVEGLAGSPSTMAPELFQGAAPSVQSDLFALGCVLFQVFTGRAPFPATSLDDLFERHRRGAPAAGAVAPDIDPEVEAVLQRCLRTDPARRPASALEALAGLPGFDPLAESLSAGVTPSPGLLHSANTDGLSTPRTALGMTVGIVVLTVLAVWLLGTESLVGVTGLRHPPAVLADRIAEHVAALGLDAPPQLERIDAGGTPAAVDPRDLEIVDRAGRFELDRPLLEVARRDPSSKRWELLRRPGTAALSYWLRESPGEPFLPSDGGGLWLRWDDPPARIPGERSLRVTHDGRLRELRVVAFDRDPRVWRRDPSSRDPAAEEQVFRVLLERAGLDPEALERVEPRGTPPVHCDTRAAWMGPDPASDGRDARVEAGLRDGGPAWFRIFDQELGPATGGGLRPENPGVRTGPAPTVYLGFNAIVFGFAFVLAWRAIVQRRADHRGARSVALMVFVIVALASACLSGDPFRPATWLDLWGGAFARATARAALFYVAYLGLEPQIRRLWPQALVSWSRLTSGRLRDPLLASHLQVGLLVGVGVALLDAALPRLSDLFGLPSPEPPHGDLITTSAMSGGIPAFGAVLQVSLRTLGFAIAEMLLVTMCRRLLPGRLAGALLASLVAALLIVVARDDSGHWVGWLVGLAQGALIVTAAYRAGLVGLWAGAIAYGLLVMMPMDVDSDGWLFPATLLGLAPLALTAGWCLRVLLGSGPKVLRRAASA